MPAFQIIVSDNRHGDYSIEEGILSSCAAELIIADCQNEEDMCAACIDADGILLDLAPLSQKVVERLNKCKIVSRYGVGFDNVDVMACTKKKIYVANVPDYCMEDVSDHALALLFTCIRQVSLRDRKIRHNEWNIHLPHSYRVKDKTLSLIGFGKISRCLLKKVSGFGLKRILVFDPYVNEREISSFNADKVDFETALKEADYISLHMPVTPETIGIINKNALALMKESAILINTSRGALVNDEALINALNNHKIAYAALDTHNKEPLPANSPFKNMDNCVLTDHTAFNTHEGMIELKTKAAQNVKAVLEGGRPIFPINQF